MVNSNARWRVALVGADDCYVAAGPGDVKRACCRLESPCGPEISMEPLTKPCRFHFHVAPTQIVVGHPSVAGLRVVAETAMATFETTGAYARSGISLRELSSRRENVARRTNHPANSGGNSSPSNSACLSLRFIFRQVLRGGSLERSLRETPLRTTRVLTLKNAA
jgi:hypothetical protein